MPFVIISELLNRGFGNVSPSCPQWLCGPNSIPRKGELLSSLPCPDQLRDSPSLLSGGYWRLFPQKKPAGM
jgi:hypothetical protein